MLKVPVISKKLEEGEDPKDWLLELVKLKMMHYNELPSPIVGFVDASNHHHVLDFMDLHEMNQMPEMEGKDVMKKTIKIVAEKVKAVRYLFISEGKMNIRDKDDESPVVMPMQDPNATPILMILDENKHRSSSEVYNLLYDPKDLSQLMGFDEMTDKGEVISDGEPFSGGGRFQGILYNPIEAKINKERAN
jgi:hypothetical protein